MLEPAQNSDKIVAVASMNRVTTKRVVSVIGVLVVVGVVLGAWRGEREKRHAETAGPQPRAVENTAAGLAAAQTAATERARYLNPGFARKPGLKNVAIVAASGLGQADPPIAAALAKRLEDENLALFTAFFKPAFFADGLFSNLFAGSLESIDRLQLTNTLDALLLAQERVQFSTNGSEERRVITADTRLDVAFLPLDLMRREQGWTFAANGAGSNPEQAWTNAGGRLIQLITSDTNMSLVPISTDHLETYPW